METETLVAISVAAVSLLAAVFVCWRMRRECEIDKARSLVRLQQYLSRLVGENWLSPRVADAIWQAVMAGEMPGIIDGVRATMVGFNRSKLEDKARELLQKRLSSGASADPAIPVASPAGSPAPQELPAALPEELPVATDPTDPALSLAASGSRAD